MYLEGVSAPFCRPAFVPYSAADTGFYGFPAEPGRVGLKLPGTSSPIHRRSRLRPPDEPRQVLAKPPPIPPSWFASIRRTTGSAPIACMYNLSTKQ